MWLLRYFLLSAGIAMFLLSAAILCCDAYLLLSCRRRRPLLRGRSDASELAPCPRWRTFVALVMLAWAPLLISAGIVIAASGLTGARVRHTTNTMSENISSRSRVYLPGKSITDSADASPLDSRAD